jgi:hypothetical protein
MTLVFPHPIIEAYNHSKTGSQICKNRTATFGITSLLSLIRVYSDANLAETLGSRRFTSDYVVINSEAVASITELQSITTLPTMKPEGN